MVRVRVRIRFSDCLGGNMHTCYFSLSLYDTHVKNPQTRLSKQILYCLCIVSGGALNSTHSHTHLNLFNVVDEGLLGTAGKND